MDVNTNTTVDDSTNADIPITEEYSENQQTETEKNNTKTDKAKSKAGENTEDIKKELYEQLYKRFSKLDKNQINILSNWIINNKLPKTHCD
jgi:uncharacterized protein Yka (UPF0111/DUF47 family)